MNIHKIKEFCLKNKRLSILVVVLIFCASISFESYNRLSNTALTIFYPEKVDYYISLRGEIEADSPKIMFMSENYTPSIASIVYPKAKSDVARVLYSFRKKIDDTIKEYYDLGCSDKISIECTQKADALNNFLITYGAYYSEYLRLTQEYNIAYAGYNGNLSMVNSANISWSSLVNDSIEELYLKNNIITSSNIFGYYQSILSTKINSSFQTGTYLPVINNGLLRKQSLTFLKNNKTAFTTSTIIRNYSSNYTINIFPLFVFGTQTNGINDAQTV